MDFILATLYFLTCCILMFRMLRGSDLVTFHLGVLGAFSLGYYVLPIIFKDLTPLRIYRERDVFIALLIHFLFFIFLIIGTVIGKKIFRKNISLKVENVDNFFSRNIAPISTLSFFIYVTYYFTQDITSYSAENFNDFFENRGPFFAIISYSGTLALALIASSVAVAWKNSNFRQMALTSTMLIICIALTIPLGQRLVVLTPMLMTLAAFYATGQSRRAIKLLFTAVLLLFIISPFAVYMRESRSDRARAADVGTIISNFDYGGNMLASSFQSILDRGDLIEVTLRMKGFIDERPSPGFIYYASVFSIPIPKVIFPSKPYLLSDNGTFGGEISNWSWRTLVGGLGSLSAFGGLVAYREAGWLGIIFNGLATGLLFVWLSKWLGGGGFIGRLFYAILFPLLAVKKVPPSFFETLADLMGQLPLLLFFILMSRFLSSMRSRSYVTFNRY